ncbi:hypothetical protein JCM10207_007394 [Rhodosporidiobolus poonsookiae]
MDRDLTPPHPSAPVRIPLARTLSAWAPSSWTRRSATQHPADSSPSQSQRSAHGVTDSPSRSLGAGDDARDTLRSRWEQGRFRDEHEQAAREGNPSSWGVLYAAGALASASARHNGAASGSSEAGGGVKRRTSRSSVASPGAGTGGARTRSASRERRHEQQERKRARSRTVTESTLQEEPESYAATDVYGSDGEETVGGGMATAGSTRSTEGADVEDDHSEDGNGSDSDASSTATLLRPPLSPSSSPSPLRRLTARLFPLSSLTRNVLKCVLAYYLASQFTFVPLLADLVGAPWDVDGPLRNAHAIATVSVYFMPARTIGGMLEADAYLLVGALYATFLTCGSMAMAVLFEKLDLLKLGHVLVLVFWLGGGYGLLAYVKIVMGKPAVATATSLVSLVCSPIITKEGSYHLGVFRTRAIEQVLLLALIGSVISNAICFLIWPMSATDKLQADLNKTLSSFGTLVDMLTKTFLLETPSTLRPETLKRAIDTHHSTFTTLKTSLSQAKWEIFDSRIRGHALTAAYDEAVRSLTRLAQGLTGMRAGCSLQWEIMRRREGEKEGLGGEEDGRMTDEVVVLEKFKEHVGESLQGLTSTSLSVLSLLRSSFARTKAGRRSLHLDGPDDAEAARPLPAEGLVQLRQELETALGLFKREHSRAVKILYRSLPAQTIYDGDFRPDVANAFADPPTSSRSSSSSQGDETARDSGPNDNLFRIYHFAYSYEEWAAELLHLVDIFIALRETEVMVEQRAVERRKRWGVLAGAVKVLGEMVPGRREGKASQLGRQFARALKTPRKKYHSVFPEIVDGALSSHQLSSSPSSASLSPFARAKLAFWHLGWHLRQPNLRFALKTGAGVAILSSAAFFPRTRPLWLEYRGEWALISFMVCSALTIGDSNYLAIMRVLGTAVGAVVAVACYSAFPENPVVLPLLGALFSAPCFYVAITRPQLAQATRFVLLTFNLTCLYSFNLREIDTEVTSIAFHRFVAVIAGVLWALVINTYVWPFEARRELRKGLSQFFLNASYLYERLVRIYSVPPPSLSRTGTIRRRPGQPTNGSKMNGEADERTALLHKEQAQLELATAAEDFASMEIELSMLLIKVSGLINATRHEPRLKGPFPVAAYRNILTSCQSILDSLTAVARMTNREAWYSVIRRDFVVPVNKERREMVGSIILYFSLLSSAVSLKTPLPAYLPPAAAARERLVAKLRDLEVVKRRLVRGGSESLLYYAYTSTVGDVIAQLDEIGRSFQAHFGIIGGSTVEDFERLFCDEPDGETLLSDGEDSGSSEEERRRRRDQAV